MKKHNNKLPLVIYDLVIFLVLAYFLYFVYPYSNKLPVQDLVIQTALSMVCIFSARFLGQIYRQIWRYGGIQCYIRLLAVDGCAFIANVLLRKLLPTGQLSFVMVLSFACMNLMCALTMRMVYRFAYKCRNMTTPLGKFLHFLLRLFVGSRIADKAWDDANKVKIAIIGAGEAGVSLAEELLSNSSSTYAPRCFVDIDTQKADRSIHGLPVLKEDEKTFSYLKDAFIQEVVLAIPALDESAKKALYERYSHAGFKVKVFDYPVIQSAGSRRHMREFDVEELLFRKPIVIHNEITSAYYRDKVILITGGGGSIGSELCRQLAKMQPKQIIILDIYENGAYDVQQELKIAYGDTLNLQIEICSITHLKSLERVFETYRPHIVINAAAHKHVPLMEKNCIEAVYNNVLGTWNLVELCEKYRVPRFMMVSTDKAVNPTNVMGATKRMCEMIAVSASTWGHTKYSTTRFGNVLGSAGSVIPLFKKQIANGGPITLTDKRIIRYFMTIPEASQLVLESGAMANNGELFVLDMGQPVRILDLAENMIQLSGVSGIKIIETGLRPGEKLYEELLVKTDGMTKTDNSLIFIEKDIPLSKEDLAQRLHILQAACDAGNDDAARQALKQVVPTYHSPEEVNACAEQAQEMQNCREHACV